MKIVLSEHELEQVHAAATILGNNLKAKITIPELSREVRLDEKKLKAGFKQVFDRGVKTYQRHLRMEKAKELLAENRPVRFISRVTGYKDDTSFIKAFKKYIGITPFAWRKKQLEQIASNSYR
jgi:AraC family transcriptional activator of pyochelin receptor